MTKAGSMKGPDEPTATGSKYHRMMAAATTTAIEEICMWSRRRITGQVGGGTERTYRQPKAGFEVLRVRGFIARAGYSSR